MIRNGSKLLFGGLMLATSSSMSSGQPPALPRTDCAAVDRSFEAIGAEIAGLQRQVEPLRARSAAATAGALAEREARLAELAFEQDCVRTDLDPDPVRGPGQPPPSWITVSTYYATNRRPAGSQGAVTSYGGQRDAATLRFGRTSVSIPTRRQPGDLALPLNLWLFEMPADPSRHFIIKSVTPLSAHAAVNEMRQRVSQLSRKSVLVFVHGYNVPFEAAALRTAQLAHDLNFPGLPVFFSWPSQGKAAAYAQDEEMSELSLVAFNRLLDWVNTLGSSEVYIVAHSMGNRVVTRALRERLAQHRPMPSGLKGLLLAAPDINADIFREQLAPALAGLSGVSRTIYSSSGDAALRASSFVHNFKRVGEARNGVLVFNGFDSVDASAAAPVRRGYGHSYVVDSPKVIRDMQALMTLRLPPARRGLARKGNPPAVHWAIR